MWDSQSSSPQWQLREASLSSWQLRRAQRDSSELSWGAAVQSQQQLSVFSWTLSLLAASAQVPLALKRKNKSLGSCSLLGGGLA